MSVFRTSTLTSGCSVQFTASVPISQYSYMMYPWKDKRMATDKVYTIVAVLRNPKIILKLERIVNPANTYFKKTMILESELLKMLSMYVNGTFFNSQYMFNKMKLPRSIRIH
mmetsp:Transcript_33168/g.38104  ORF Transcript_33168/g.38104 Transcript_33168/m.38104 type:complete len:112 (-) Transcript_33168:27-362(-)